MVVTSRFHQLRSHLTFRCAVRQRLPAARQPQAHPCFSPWQGLWPFRQTNQTPPHFPLKQAGGCHWHGSIASRTALEKQSTPPQPLVIYMCRCTWRGCLLCCGAAA